MKKVIYSLLILLLFNSCGLIRICIERPKDIANAYKYTDQIPLSAESMKQLIAEDTAHYKVFVFFSHCCGPCIEQMRLTYSKLWNADTANVRWYFVLDNTCCLKYDNTRFLQYFGINTPYMYYLHDDDPRFNILSDDGFLNLAQYVFSKQPELEDVINGIPNLFIVNPQGRLKLEYHQYADGTTVVGNMDCLAGLVYKDYYITYPNLIPYDTLGRIQGIDFNQLDTVDWSCFGNYNRKAKICTPNGCH